MSGAIGFLATCVVLASLILAEAIRDLARALKDSAHDR